MHIERPNEISSTYDSSSIAKPVVISAPSPELSPPTDPEQSDVEERKSVNTIAGVEDQRDPSEHVVRSMSPHTPRDTLSPAKDPEGSVDVTSSSSEVTKAPDPTKVFVIDSDLALFKKVIQFGCAAIFRVSTIDAGAGTLNITSRGPGKATVRVFDNKDGTYTCEFTPSIAGKYHIDISWNDEHITGSPFLLTFESNKSLRITGLNLENESFKIGMPQNFKVHCDEVSGGVLEIHCKPSSAAAIQIIPIGSATYQCEILPKEVGNVEIHVRYNGKHILGSPFHVDFYVGGDASKVRMVASDISEQDEVNFTISAEGAGKGKLTSTLEKISSKEMLPVSVTKVSDDRYNIGFTAPTDNEELMLNIKYDDEHIIGSPFKLIFDPPEADASKCTSSGNGLVASIVNKTAKFIVDTKEAGKGELSVTIDGESGSLLPKINTIEETQMEVTYEPTNPGKHTISVRWSEEDIPGSPFTVYAYHPSDPNLLKVENPVSEVFIGTPVKFVVTAQRGLEPGELSVVAQNARGNAFPGNVERCDDGQTYKCLFEPPAIGKYMVHAMWNGVDVAKSPYTLSVLNPPKPANVRAYGPGLEDGFVGQEGIFTVETADAGSGTLNIRVHGPKGAFKISMRRHPDNNRTIFARYNPILVGKYIVDITWSDTHIPGSPFSVNIADR